MKTKEQFEVFVAELSALSEKHGIKIAGTCISESIYGEISLFDLTDPESWGWLYFKPALPYVLQQDKEGCCTWIDLA